MEYSVLTHEGKDTGRKITLPKATFGIKPNEHLVYLSVKQFLANQRQGTHKSKEKSEVTASTKKIQKQKGTGNARRGSIKSPLLKGGGSVFGPKPRDYSFKINKQEKRIARNCILSDRAKNGRITILEAFSLPEPKTKAYLDFLKRLALASKKTLLIVHEPLPRLALAARNLPHAHVTTVGKLNIYDLMHANQLIFFENAISTLEKLCL